jgi:cyclic pyranopterin phosphate synthase
MSISVTDTLDRPVRDLRLSVTDRCNFRCSYCMPADVFGEKYRFLPRSEILSFEEIERLVRLFSELGVGKLRISGGEPLLRADLTSLVERLARTPGIRDLALTTNGVLLPRLGTLLRKAGLSRVTISLDSLDDAVFKRMNGERGSVEQVLEGIAAAKEAGFSPIKINCVVRRGMNDGDVVELARHFKGSGAVLRFIEYMDVGTKNGWDWEQVVPAREILERIEAELPLEPTAPNYRGEVARRWRYRDGGGEIGIIASVTQPFCGDCTRARLTTDGKLVTCLFGTAGTDLRGPMREGVSDGELRELIRRVWTERGDRYSESRSSQPTEGESGARRIEMYQVGG